MRNIIIWGFVAAYLTIFYPGKVFAGKILPRFKQTYTTNTKAVTSGVGIRPSLRGDRRALNVYFSNLSKVKSVSYMLIYQANGVDKGAGGTIDVTKGDSINRELIFGTESSGVYRYDEGIANMKLEVTTELLNGKKTLKRFRIKV